ncbi:hypothetical protein CRUP_015455, partial [Coryphaenoides rupestris]
GLQQGPQVGLTRSPRQVGLTRSPRQVGLTRSPRQVGLTRSLCQEVQIGREGLQQVQDVVSAVVPQDALCLDAGAEFHSGTAVVQDFVPLDSQRAARLYLHATQVADGRSVGGGVAP